MNKRTFRLVDIANTWGRYLLPVAILIFVLLQTHSLIRGLRPSVALHVMGRLHLRDSAGRAAAFASLMPVYDGGRSMSVDLMRYRTDIRGGMMDALFIHLLLRAKDEGYERFNLGRAPLASVGESVYDHRFERMARWIYLKGSHFSPLQGLRKFKEKYDPEWEARYLAYPPNVSLPLLMLRITRLIARGPAAAAKRGAP